MFVIAMSLIIIQMYKNKGKVEISVSHKAYQDYKLGTPYYKLMMKMLDDDNIIYFKNIMPM